MSLVDYEVTLADIKRGTSLIMEIMDLKTSVRRRNTLVKNYYITNEYKSQEERFNKVFNTALSILSTSPTKADKDELGVVILSMVEILDPKISAKQRETLVKQLNFTITPAELEKEFANILVS